MSYIFLLWYMPYLHLRRFFFRFLDSDSTPEILEISYNSNNFFSGPQLLELCRVYCMVWKSATEQNEANVSCFS